MEILDALKELDPKVDDHWTADGSPRVDVVSKLVGKELKRADITAAAPHFTRTSTEGDEEDAQVQEDEEQEDLSQDEEQEEVSSSEEELSVLDLPIADVLSDLNLVDAVDKALQEKDQALIREINAIKEERDQIAVKTALLDRARRKLSSNKRNKTTEDIQAYLRTQRKLREERNTPQSDLDKSFARRNPRGQERPSRPLMGQ